MAVISHPLEFERPVVDLEMQLEALKDQIAAGDISRQDEYARLEGRVAKLRKEIFGRLIPYQRVQLARHFDRPGTLDYVKFMITDFVEFHGDRLFRDDPAIVGGVGRLGEKRIMLIGHQRGHITTERLQRNFGMAQPEGYRKALRLFHMAQKFNLPIVTLIDTQGAFPGMEAEERGQAEAIARNLMEMAGLRVPIVSVVIGEGGSGGALALGVSDKILMLENACYSVITPEGCASILWKQDRGEAPQNQAALAAEMMQVTAQDLLRNKIIDEVLAEPYGGAHYNHKEMAESLAATLHRYLNELMKLSIEDLLEKRYQKFRVMGPFSEG